MESADIPIIWDSGDDKLCKCWRCKIYVRIASGSAYCGCCDVSKQIMLDYNSVDFWILNKISDFFHSF